VDNEFLKYAPVVLIGSEGVEAVLTASENYGNVTGDEDLACDFAITFPSYGAFVGFDNTSTNFACVEFDATECEKVSTSAPTEVAEPTMAPTTRPIRFTSAPSPGPTIRQSTPAPVAATDFPTAGAAGRAIISLSAAAAALTAYFVF
jgi:hypothetical protein